MMQVQSQSISLVVDFPIQPRRLSLNNKKEMTTRRRVNFASEVIVASDSNNDSHDVHSHDSWYTSQEYKQMKHTRAQDICTVTKTSQSPEFHESLSPQHLNLIGVERYLSKEVLIESKLRRDAHVNAVLDEQERQDNNMTLDAEALGDLSRRHSKWSVERAQIAAQFSRMLDEV